MHLRDVVLAVRGIEVWAKCHKLVRACFLPQLLLALLPAGVALAGFGELANALLFLPAVFVLLPSILGGILLFWIHTVLQFLVDMEEANDGPLIIVVLSLLIVAFLGIGLYSGGQWSMPFHPVMLIPVAPLLIFRILTVALIKGRNFDPTNALHELSPTIIPLDSELVRRLDLAGIELNFRVMDSLRPPKLASNSNLPDAPPAELA